MDRRSPKKVSINHYQIPKANVKTMTNMQKTVKVMSKTVVMNGEVMYLRLLAVKSFKKVRLQRVLSFENAPLSL